MFAIKDCCLISKNSRHLGQLWKIGNGKKLENKAGTWKYNDIKWLISNNGTQFYITDQETGEALGFRDFGNGTVEVLLNTTSDQKNGKLMPISESTIGSELLNREIVYFSVEYFRYIHTCRIL